MNSSKSKNWLFVLPTDKISGSEHIIKSVAVFLAERNCRCTVLILTRKKYLGWETLEKEMDITYLAFGSYFIGSLFLPFYFLFKSFKEIDYSFSSQTIINGTLGFSKKLGLLRSKIILRESNSIFELLNGVKLKIYSIFYLLGYKDSSIVICQTDYMKKKLEEALPNFSKKLNLKTIPNPFNFADIEARSGPLSNEFINKSFIVAAGRLAPVKGFDVLLNVFKDIHEKFPSLHLIILGEGKDRDLLKRQSENLGIAEVVFMPGYVNNVYTFFKESKACVLSSRIEGFPNVLLQMMSQNNSVVSTLCAGGINEIQGLFTCPTEDENALKQAIIKAITTNNSQNDAVFQSDLKARTLDSFTNMMLSFEK